MTKDNPFATSPDYPYHLSVGAVVVNDRGEIAANYFERIEHPKVGVLTDIKVLMRESLESGEPIEAALHRGLEEEMGLRATVISYLGPMVTFFQDNDHTYRTEKTTLYFLCSFQSVDPALKANGDIEATGSVVWETPEVLALHMRAQGVRTGRPDSDESDIVMRATAHIQAISR